MRLSKAGIFIIYQVGGHGNTHAVAHVVAAGMYQRQVVDGNIFSFSEGGGDTVIIGAGGAIIYVIGDALFVIAGEDEPGTVIAGPHTVGRGYEPITIADIHAIALVQVVYCTSLGLGRNYGDNFHIFRHFGDDAVG